MIKGVEKQLKKVVIRLLSLILLLIGVAPTGAGAYSYGDPNQEDVAETFKLIVSKANSSDWAGVNEVYQVRRSEISSHFGESVAVTLDANIEAKDKELLFANYKAVLVMNLKRRFDYALKDINDYSKAKLLLAKAKGTYDVLAPYVGGNVSKDSINTSFNNALAALGNPGLFGVGEQAINPDVLKKETDYIYKTLKPLFPYKETKKQAPKAEVPTPVKAEVPKQEQKPVTTKVTKTEEDKSTSQQTNQNSNTDTKKAEPETVAVAASTEEIATEQEEKSGEQETKQEGEAPEEKEEVKQNEKTGSLEETASEVEHAPMERTSKTNTSATIFIFIGIAALIAGSIWFVKKKGII